MAIKDFVVKNKKKSICFLTALIVCIVSVFSVIIVKQINAGVFKKDENGNTIPVNEIKILEIVARDGEQVLGYTVEGQEPISVSDIENYKGTMDLDVEDFKNATGYEVTKKVNNDGTFSYKVKGSVLNRTFNDNVLGESMSKGEIKVNAIQAADVKVSDVEWADLIYINSNDYNSNLMYYYDQFVCGGSMGYGPGEMGKEYNDIYFVNQNKLYGSIDKIIRSVGNKKIADTLTNEDFEFVKDELDSSDEIDASLTNYVEYNLDVYKQGLANLDEEISEDIKEGIERIDKLFKEINSTEEEKSLEKLTDSAGKKLSEEDKVNLKICFLKAGFSKYYELNYEKYFDEIEKYTYGITYSGIGKIIDDVNASVMSDSLNTLLQYKIKANEALTNQENNSVIDDSTDKYGFNEEDYEKIASCFKLANLGKIYDGLLSEYTENFLKQDFIYDDSVNKGDSIRGLIEKVNDIKKNEVLNELADSIADAEKLEVFCENAESNFEYANIKEYNKYYINNYVNALKNIDNADDFKTDGKCDLSKIEKFIETTNEEEVLEDMEMSCDLVWKVAVAIYNRAVSEDVALMYNSQLLTSNKLGNYTQNLVEVAKANKEITNSNDKVSVDNTNNVYKMLLLLRQIRDSYYSENLAANIDSNGTYYPDGTVGEAEGIDSWDKNTFDNIDGSANDTSVNFSKYREPEVVGKTYGSDGKEGLAVNYVYKRIYSFTGDQFFGGAKFIGAVASGTNYIITANSGYNDSASSEILTKKLEDDGYIMISTEKNSTYQKNSELYAHFWKDGGGVYKDEFVRVEGEKKSSNGKYVLYKLYVPKGYDSFLITTAQNYNQKTSDYKLPSDYKGKLFYINGSKNIVQDTSGRNNYVLAGITNSLPNDTVSFTGSMEMRFWAFNNEVESNNFTANYRLYVDGTLIYSGNNQGYHFTENTADCGEQPFKIGDVISIKDSQTVVVGDDEIKLYANSGSNSKGQLITLNSNNMLMIEFSYSSSGNDNSSVTNNYYYQMTKPEYNIAVTNFTKDGNIEYVNYADITFNFTNMEYVKYAIDGSAYTNVENNQTVNIGEDYKIGTATKLIVAYKPIGCDEINVSTTLVKSEMNGSEECNYLSENTATNTTGLTNDPLLSTTENSAIAGKKKADVIVYLLGVSLMDVNYPINVLEVQPQANVSDLNNADMARKILTALNVEIPKDIDKNYSKYVNVTYMSVKEFNSRNDELEATYDLIYFGVNPGYQTVYADGRAEGRTKYNDKTMDGLVYTGIGDKYTILAAYGGLAADDYEFVEENFYTDARISSAKNATYGIDINGNAKKDGSNVQCWSTSQTFNINVENTTPDSEEIVTIERNDMYVSIQSGQENKGSDANVCMRTKSNSDYQRWILHRNTDGSISFENYGYALKNQHLYMTIQNGTMTNGTNIMISELNNKKEQKWIIGTETAGMKESLYIMWTKYYTTGMTGNENSSWNLDKLNNSTGHYYMKSEAKTTRIGGNDITVRKMEELLDYLKSGYPILLADEIMDCDSDRYFENNQYDSKDTDYYKNDGRPDKWPYVDHNSKMYNFILQAKALGKDENGNYTGLDANGNKVFKDNKTYASLVSMSMMEKGSNPEYLTSDNKFEGGLRFAFKRVQILDFEFKSGPKQYTDGVSSGNIGKTIEKDEADYTKYNIVLGFKDDKIIDESQIKDKYDYKMYIDKSGVGKFEEIDTVELSPTYELIKNENGYVTGVKVSGDWPSNIEGFIPWKVEAVDKNNSGLKYTYIGYSAFKRETVKDVYVLWLYRKDSLSNNTLNFRDAVSKKSSAFSSDYNIHLVSMSLTEFNKYYSSDSACDVYRDEKDKNFTSETSKLKVKSVLTYLSGKDYVYIDNMSSSPDSYDEALEFDMIVSGFSDSYSNLGLSDIAAMKNIEYFVNSGHSLLYSHDSSSFNTTIHRYSTKGYLNNSRQQWALYETYFLKSLVGQDRYGLTVSGTDLPEEYVNARKYLDMNKIKQSDLRGITETWTFIGSSDNASGGNKQYTTEIGGSTYANVNSFKATNSIMQLNKGQITMYPYVLPEGGFTVSTTHTQYSELNLEDKDVTVWYALDAKQDLYYYTKGDGCNNYYIYSKGNVTYTGAGHSSIGDSGNEALLFINTLVAAIKTGNYAPVVTVNNAVLEAANGKSEKYIYRYGENGLYVSFTVSDYDLKDKEENGFSDFRIYVDVDGDGKYSKGDILINNPDNESDTVSTYMRDASNKENKINITKSNIKNKVTNVFFISDDELNVLNGLLSKDGKDIYSYDFIIEAVDNGYLKADSDEYKESTKIKAADKFKLKYSEEVPVTIFDLN